VTRVRGQVTRRNACILFIGIKYACIHYTRLALHLHYTRKDSERSRYCAHVRVFLIANKAPPAQRARVPMAPAS